MTMTETEVVAFNAAMEAAKVRATQHKVEHDRSEHQGRPKPGCFQCFRERLSEGDQA